MIINKNHELDLEFIQKYNLYIDDGITEEPIINLNKENTSIFNKFFFEEIVKDFNNNIFNKF